MSITRDHGAVVIQCDGPNCHEVRDDDTKDFKEAIRLARNAGWTMREVGESWVHFHSTQCRDRYRPGGG